MLDTRPLPVTESPPRCASADFLDRLVAHDEGAFSELVHVHGPRLLAVATRYLPCQADAEDAVQEAFVNVVRFVGAFNRESAFETWLHRIVVNCALMILRARRRRPVITNADTQLTGSMASPVRGGSIGAPDAALEELEWTRKVLASVCVLPPVQQSAFRLRYRDGFGVHAIADMLDVSPSTVKTRLHRARRTLQASLGAPPS